MVKLNILQINSKLSITKLLVDISLNNREISWKWVRKIHARVGKITDYIRELSARRQQW